MPYKHPRGTRAALNALASASGLVIGQIYLLTDESRLAIAIAVNAFQTYAKEGEGGGTTNNPAFTGSMTVAGPISASTEQTVKLASTTNFANTAPTATVLTAAAAGVTTVDGTALVLNDLVLLKDQTLPAENGVYKVTTVGTAGAATVLTRVNELNTWANIATNTLVTVSTGTVNGLTIWVATPLPGGTLGTTPITFASTNVIVDVYTSSGTWTKRPGLKSAYVMIIGGGGGGGSGRVGLTSTGRGGGAGGGGGAVTPVQITASELASTEAVTVGAAGTGGAAVAASTNGIAGTAGGNSIFRNTYAGGGAGGGGGTIASATGGNSGMGLFYNNSGGSGTTGNGNNATISNTGQAAGQAGAGGGGCSTTNTVGTGGNSAKPFIRVGGFNTAVVVDALGGASTGGSGGNGGNYGAYQVGGGGAGGGGNLSTSGGAGGSAGGCGSGGGGGGGGTDGTVSIAAGGNGGAGLVVVYNYF